MSQIIKCPECGKTFLIQDYEIELSPWPHYTCSCGIWIPIF